MANPTNPCQKKNSEVNYSDKKGVPLFILSSTFYYFPFSSKKNHKSFTSLNFNQHLQIPMIYFNYRYFAQERDRASNRKEEKLTMSEEGEICIIKECGAR
jgi:hypothetical protein